MAAPSTSADQQPNVLLITLDQLRADSLGCSGHPLVRTPVIGEAGETTANYFRCLPCVFTAFSMCLKCDRHATDALAARGVHFQNHFNQATPCGPSRNSLHTGMYMMNHRGVQNGTPLPRCF